MAHLSLEIIIYAGSSAVLTDFLAIQVVSGYQVSAYKQISSSRQHNPEILGAVDTKCLSTRVPLRQHGG